MVGRWKDSDVAFVMSSHCYAIDGANGVYRLAGFQKLYCGCPKCRIAQKVRWNPAKSVYRDALELELESALRKVCFDDQTD